MAVGGSASTWRSGPWVQYCIVGSLIFLILYIVLVIFDFFLSFFLVIFDFWILFVCYTVLIPCGKFGPPCLAAARAALPSPTEMQAGSFRASVIYRTLTWTTGYLTRVRDPVIVLRVCIHTGVGHKDNFTNG